MNFGGLRVDFSEILSIEYIETFLVLRSLRLYTEH